MISGTYTMTHRGVARTYELFVPGGYSNKIPARLVIVFHGWGGDEKEFMGDRTVIGESNARGYIVVAPRGIGSGPPDNRKNSWTFRGSATGLAGAGGNPGVRGEESAICDTAMTPTYTYPSCRRGTARNTCSWTQCQDDDVDFVVTLARHLEAKMCVDATHVFAAGGSTGGMFTWELGQNPRSAPLFKAIAPLIGLPHRGYLDGPGKPGGTPVILITGRNDDTVPPGAWDDPGYTTTSNDRDRFYYTGATAISKVWAAAAGCDTRGNEASFNSGYPQADCRSYCAANASGWPAVLDCRAQMGHEYGLSWSWKLILDFFDRH
jgi:poly(3-hydroxybutyrate) depolymerase